MSNSNKYEQIASKYGNIWLIILIIIINISLVASLLQGKTGYILFLIPSLSALALSLLARYKIKNRYSIEYGYNLIRTTLSKRVQGSKETVILGEFIQYKQKYILAYSFDYLDVESLPVVQVNNQISQTDIDQNYLGFIQNLPAFFEVEILLKKTQSSEPAQLKNLGLELASYKLSNTVTYFLNLKVNKKDLAKAQNSIKEIFVRELDPLTPIQTLSILN
mgnify:CR=1 FL=1